MTTKDVPYRWKTCKFLEKETTMSAKDLPGPKSRSAVCRYCRPWPFTLLIYSYV